MSEAIIFENMPYNLFLKQRMEFVVICGDHLAANVMRVIESEMIRLKEAWQAKVEKATEEKKTPPKEPKAWWVRLSLSQIIARLYMYDSDKLKKPESEDLNSPEWVEYRYKKALSISKGTLRKAIKQLKSLGFLLERSKPGDEFGAPIWTLHKENVQKALKTLPANPFAIFHSLGGGSKFEYGGEVQNLNVPPTNFECGDTQNLDVPGSENERGEMQNLDVDIDSSIDSPEDSEIDSEEEGTSREDHADTGSLYSPTPALQCHLCFEEAEARCPACNQWTCLSHRQTWLPGSAHPLLVDAAVCDACAKRYETEVRTRRTTPTPALSPIATDTPTTEDEHDRMAHSDNHRVSTAQPVRTGTQGHTHPDQQHQEDAQQPATSERVAPSAAMADSGYEKDEEETVKTPAVRVPAQQLSTFTSSSAQASGKVSHARTEGRKKKTEEPEPITLSHDAEKIWRAWCSLFTVEVELIPSNAAAAEKLVKPARIWCSKLHWTLAEWLKSIKDNAYEADSKGYYRRRGVKLFDIPRELEGWQSAKEHELSTLAQAANPAPTTPKPIDPTLQALRQQQMHYRGVTQ